MSLSKKEIEEYKSFSKTYLSYEFNNINLLVEALTHSSFANESNDQKTKDNERLEFLGDAVLEAIISEKLYLDEANFAEGVMTKIRSLTVREESLVKVSRSIGLQNHLRFGQGEEKTGGRDKSSNSEDAMEAIIGAIFIDGGWEASKSFVNNVLSPIYDYAKSGDLVYDYKSKLYQVLQAEENLPQVNFVLLSETGPAHDKTFTISVEYKGIRYTPASANSKKMAEQGAACNFLNEYKIKEKNN